MVGVCFRVDHLYSFFVQWSPDVYGKEAREQGFVLVEKDELDMIDNFFSDPASCSWEVSAVGKQVAPLWWTLTQKQTSWRVVWGGGLIWSILLVFTSDNLSHRQIITIDEAKRRQSFSSCDGDLSVDALPILSDTSDLLQDTHIEKVSHSRLISTLSCSLWRE